LGGGRYPGGQKSSIRLAGDGRIATARRLMWAGTDHPSYSVPTRRRRRRRHKSAFNSVSAESSEPIDRPIECTSIACEQRRPVQYSTRSPPDNARSYLYMYAATAELNSTTRTRPDRTRTDFVGDPHGPNGVSPQKSPCGSGRVRVVEFSYYWLPHRQGDHLLGDPKPGHNKKCKLPS